MSNRSFRGIRTVRFNDFELDVRAFELRREGSRVRLQEQPLRILTALLERPGELVTREEIRRRLWPDGTVVEVSHGINAAVQRLREALGESAENPRYIETLARRGYRFIAPVEIGVRTPPEASENAASENGTRENAASAAPESSAPVAVSHFRVLERLGIGGMGVVYRAEDQKLGRHVALKFLPGDLANDPASLARFRREAQAASALNHPNICTIYGVEECDGKPVIVMEYIEGESLEAARARGPLPVTKVIAMAIQMAGALDAAHRAGIVHRDLKPANVLVTAAGVKVLDFGLAKMDRPPMLGFEPPHVTKEGAILGTLHYLSPEQVQGKPAEPGSDIFSFGVLLYEMLAGRRAFDGPNAARVMASILTLEPAPLPAGVPQWLDLALRRCLAKEPEDRWQSARDLKAALELLPAARQSQSVLPSAEPALAPQPARAALPRASRRKWMAAFLLAALLAGAWYFGRGSDAMLPRPASAESQAAAVPPARSGNAPVKKTAAAAPSLRIWPPEPSPALTLHLSAASITRLSLSPDGKRIAYSSGGHLWIAGVNGEAPVEYDTAAGTPFWSPDGRFVAAAGPHRELRRFEPGTQNTKSICIVDTTFSGAWARDGTILIGLQRDGIYRVPSDGGELRRVTTLDAARGETRHIVLGFLPDRRRFLFLAGSKEKGRSMLYAASLDAPGVTAIMPTPSNVEYAEGYLVYAENSMLLARKFDAKTLHVSGHPILLGQSVSGDAADAAAISMGNFSVAGNALALLPPGRGGAATVVNNWSSGLK